MRPTTIATALAIAGFAVTSAIAQQAPQGAQGQRQGQNAAYCLQGADGSKNCSFATMAQCDAAKKGQATSTCVQNTQTTGAGGMAPGAGGASRSPSQPTTGQTPANPSGPSGSSQPAR
jgi:Protein of unknown function (DUF3551)